MEFTSSCYAIELIESWCKDLVKEETAKCSHDSSKYMRRPDGRVDYANNGFNTKEYTIRTWPVDSVARLWFGNNDVVIRFWYDRRYNNETMRKQDKAGVKICREHLDTLLRSVSISKLLKQLGVTKESPDFIKNMLIKAITVKDGEAKPELQSTIEDEEE